jgi:hypothetical protein
MSSVVQVANEGECKQGETIRKATQKAKETNHRKWSAL